MITKQEAMIYRELFEVIKHMNKKYQDMLPPKMIEFLETYGDKEYDFKIDQSIPLSKQNLNRQTRSLMAVLNLKYWCESEQERNELVKLYTENERKYQEEVKQKYKIKEFVKDTDIQTEQTNDSSKAEIKNNQSKNEIVKTETNSKWYQKIYNFILKIFRK